MFNASQYRSARLSATKKTYARLTLPRTSEGAHSAGVAASARWVAAPVQSGGTVAVLTADLDSHEAVGELEQGVLSAHGRPVSDLAFSPFDPDALATTSHDGTVRLWSVPREGLLPRTAAAAAPKPVAEVSGLAGGVTHALRFHGSAEGVLAAGGKGHLSVLDLGRAAVSRSFEAAGFGKDVVALDWSLDGSLLAAVGKDQKVHVLDPRAADAGALAATPKYRSRCASVSFVGGGGGAELLMVVGATMSREPRLEFFDPRRADAPVKSFAPRLSSGTVMSLYDRDTGLLFMGNRGSSMFTAFDVSGDPLACASASVPDAVQGACLLPKAALDHYACEIDRILAVTAGAIRPVAVHQPRKSPGFHADAYADTPSSRPAMTFDEWAGGEDREPLTESVEDIYNRKEEVAPPKAAAAAAAAAAPEEEKAKTVEDIPAVRTERRKAAERHFQRSTFQHMTGHEPPAASKDRYVYDLPLDPCLAPANNLVMNDRFWATPLKAMGGSAVCVMRHDRLGRAGPDVFRVRGHTEQVTAIGLSATDPNAFCSAAGDGRVRVYSLPEGGLEADLEEAAATFSAGGRVTTADWHPRVSGLLVSSSAAYDGAALQLWDVESGAGRPAFEVPAGVLGEAVQSVAFSPDTATLLVCARDRRARVVDPRDGARVAAEFEPFEGARDTRALYVGDTGRVLTVGFGPRSQRSVSLWDVRNLGAGALHRCAVDSESMAPIPVYDHDTQTLMLASNGSRVMRTYQVHGGSLELLNTFKLQADACGFALRSKHACDVRAVEVAVGATLSAQASTVVPVSYRVPRKRVGFFQDDLFPPTAVCGAVVDAAGWAAGGGGKGPEVVDLCPDGMTPLSKAPAEAITDKQKRYLAQKEREAEKPKAGFMGTAEDVQEHFRQQAAKMDVSSNPWDAKRESDDDDPVSDSEWD